MRTKQRAGMKTRFSRKLWNLWLARLTGPDEADPQYKYLSSGIAQFRAKLADKEPMDIS